MPSAEFLFTRKTISRKGAKLKPKLAKKASTPLRSSAFLCVKLLQKNFAAHPSAVIK
jgi:hypothetical protein